MEIGILENILILCAPRIAVFLKEKQNIPGSIPDVLNKNLD